MSTHDLANHYKTEIEWLAGLEAVLFAFRFQGTPYKNEDERLKALKERVDAFNQRHAQQEESCGPLTSRKPSKAPTTPATADWAPFKSIFDELTDCLPADVQTLYQACKTADGETIDQALDAHLQAHGEPEQQALAQLGEPLDAAGDHRKHKRPANVDQARHGLSREAGMAVYLAEHMKWNRP